MNWKNVKAFIFGKCWLCQCLFTFQSCSDSDVIKYLMK